MMRKIYFSLVCFFYIFSLSAQSGSYPFPTLLKGVIQGNQVILSWRDTSSLDGEIYHVYRDNQEITTETISSARLVGRAEENTQTFTDIPPGGGSWYYLVTAEDSKYHYSIAVPYSNTLIQPLVLDNGELNKVGAARIENLKSRIQGGKILLTFDKDKQDRSISLYRSTSPFVSSLSQATLLTVLEKDICSWIDEPIPGISYYYAAVDRELVSRGGEKILYQGNHTEDPVFLPLSEFLDNSYAVLPIRKAPLPTLQLEKYYPLPRFDIVFPERQDLSAQLDKNLKAFLNGVNHVDEDLHEAYILTRDREAASSPIEEKLQIILGEYFLKERWDDAEKELFSLLSEGDDPVIKGRIYFYRGQCRFFSGEYEAAYFEFLLSRDGDYLEAVRWMEACLDNIS